MMLIQFMVSKTMNVLKCCYYCYY